MPTSKTYLPDVNVWLNLAYEGHVHNAAAAQWMKSVETGLVAFCRPTQMGLLRLLTNPKVMTDETLNKNQAWEVYDRIREDPRIIFLNEPGDVEENWRFITQSSSAPKDWTDAYLLAFAKTRALTFVTFDQALAKSDVAPVVLLS